MTIGAAIILAIGLILASMVVAIGIVVGSVCSTETAVQLFLDDDDWEKYQNRMVGVSKKYVSSMFGD